MHFNLNALLVVAISSSAFAIIAPPTRPFYQRPGGIRPAVCSGNPAAANYCPGTSGGIDYFRTKPAVAKRLAVSPTLFRVPKVPIACGRIGGCTSGSGYFPFRKAAKRALPSTGDEENTGTVSKRQIKNMCSKYPVLCQPACASIYGCGPGSRNRFNLQRSIANDVLPENLEKRWLPGVGSGIVCVRSPCPGSRPPGTWFPYRPSQSGFPKRDVTDVDEVLPANLQKRVLPHFGPVIVCVRSPCPGSSPAGTYWPYNRYNSRLPKRALSSAEVEEEVKKALRFQFPPGTVGFPVRKPWQYWTTMAGPKRSAAHSDEQVKTSVCSFDPKSPNYCPGEKDAKKPYGSIINNRADVLKDGHSLQNNMPGFDLKEMLEKLVK